MVVTPTIKDYIMKDNLEEIYELVAHNTTDGMVSMNGSLARLVEEEKLSQEEALDASSEPEELNKKFRGAY